MSGAGRAGLVLLILACAYGAIVFVAESKNERLAGENPRRLDDTQPAAMRAFGDLMARLRTIGKDDLASRLEALQRSGHLWTAPNLDERLRAIYVNSLNLVTRIYISEAELLSRRKPFATDPSIPDEYRRAFAWIALAGTLFHELCHYDGLHDERATYEREVAWYRSLSGSAFSQTLREDERAAYDWAIAAAIRSALKAKAKDTPQAGPASAPLVVPRWQCRWYVGDCRDRPEPKKARGREGSRDERPHRCTAPPNSREEDQRGL